LAKTVDISFVNIYIIIINNNQKGASMDFEYKMKIAIGGPGAIGKSTTIAYLKELIGSNVNVINDRGFIYPYFEAYLADMKKTAFKTQQIFFEGRIEQLEKAQTLDNFIINTHLIDDFVFPTAHKEMGNFSIREQTD
jgi:deoxyadenosine/deoxycytidine kinase